MCTGFAAFSPARGRSREAARFLDALEEVDADTVTRLRDLRQRA
jgi:hypothetical protein